MKLREAGHDVVWIEESSPGIDDMAILSIGRVEHRVLLTFDHDFGELAFKYGKTLSEGIVLLRLPPTSPGELTSTLLNLFADQQITFSDRFTTVSSAEHIRQRRLPESP